MVIQSRGFLLKIRERYIGLNERHLGLCNLASCLNKFIVTLTSKLNIQTFAYSFLEQLY